MVGGNSIRPGYRMRAPDGPYRSDRVTLRHGLLAAYRCFLPDLAGFTGLPCARPDHHHGMNYPAPTLPRRRGHAETVLMFRRDWRRGRDSNPGWSFPHTRSPGVLLQPLGHLSTHPESTDHRPRVPTSRVSQHKTLEPDMAERVGFEPTWELPPNPLSRRARYDHFGTSPLRSTGGDPLDQGDPERWVLERLHLRKLAEQPALERFFPVLCHGDHHGRVGRIVRGRRDLVAAHL